MDAIAEIARLIGNILLIGLGGYLVLVVVGLIVCFCIEIFTQWD